MSDKIDKEDEEKISQCLNNEANLRSMILRSMSTHSAAFLQSNLGTIIKK